MSSSATRSSMVMSPSGSPDLRAPLVAELLLDLFELLDDQR
jgi:hypothetical protein